MSISWVHRANICTIINFSTKYYKWSYCLACSLNREPSNHSATSYDRCHTCDFIARFCRANARLYCAIKSQTLWLSSCTLRIYHINKHGFCATFPLYDPLSQTQFPNGETVPYLIFLSYCIIPMLSKQRTETKLLPRISLSENFLLWTCKKVGWN